MIGRYITLLSSSSFTLITKHPIIINHLLQKSSKGTVAVKEFNISLTYTDMSTLDHLNWLNDQVRNSFAMNAKLVCLYQIMVLSFPDHQLLLSTTVQLPTAIQILCVQLILLPEALTKWLQSRTTMDKKGKAIVVLLY